MKTRTLLNLCLILALLLGFGGTTIAADDPILNDINTLVFRFGTSFFSKSYAYTLTEEKVLSTYYLGSAKEAAYAEIPVVGASGIGLAVAEKVTGLKVTTDNKAIKASYDKKNNCIRLTTVGLGRGRITVSGTVKDGKISRPYGATLDFVVMQPSISHVEMLYKVKGIKEQQVANDVLNYPMQVGDSLSVSVRFYEETFRRSYTYGGGKKAGVWQSLDPGYLSVTPTGKLKALTPTEDNSPAEAVFIDFRGGERARIVVPISPKPNPKLDKWKTTLSFQYKGLAKGSTQQTVYNGVMSWYLTDGPFQLTTFVEDAKSGKQVKPNVFYYSTNPEVVAVDEKGVCYPLKAASETVQIYAVAVDSFGIKDKASVSLTVR